MQNNNIAHILHHALTGQLTDDERAMLDAWRADHEDLYQQIMTDGQVDRLYRAYAAADSEQAWKAFKAQVNGIGPSDGEPSPTASLNDEPSPTESAPSRWTVVWRRIAVAAAVVAVAAVVWWQWGKQPASRPVPAPMSQAMTVAMHTAEQQAVTGVACTVTGHRLEASTNSTLQAQLAALEAAGVSLDEATGTLQTRHDKEFWTTLSDGTRVHLNYNTRLSYPLLFGDRREVELDGEAYFIVAKDEAQRPFTVRTPDGEVRDYGTEFNVNTRGTSGQTEVVLVRGSVGVASSGTETRLHPGQLATMDGTAAAHVSQVDIGPYIAWNTGQFTFDNCPLDQLMHTVGSWHGCTVVFRNNADRHIPFMGTIDRYAPLAEILQSVETITGLKAQLDGKQIIISH